MHADADKRGSWLDMLRGWRDRGDIDASDENALIRHYDERESDLREALKKIAPEYERRVRAEGREQADQWLGDIAREMGRSDGESTQRMLSSLSR